MSYDFNDEQLKAALWKVETYSLDSLPKNEDISYQFSPKFQKRVRKLIKLSKKRESPVKPYRLRRRIAILIASIIIMLATSLSVFAMRETIVEFISNIYEKYTEIFFDKSDVSFDDEFVAFKPDYIPDGFITNTQDFDDGVYLEYINDSDFIIYQQQKLDNITTHINTEGIELKDTELNGHSAKYFSNQGIQNLIWYDDSYMYYVSSTLSEDEVYKIAESIKCK